MNIKKLPPPGSSVVSARLIQLAPLSATEVTLLQEAERRGRQLTARSELTREGEPIGETQAILSGFAVQERVLVDGQRQILSLLVPGDLIGNCWHTSALAPTTTVAITDMLTCPVPVARPGTTLAQAYACSAAFEQSCLLAQVTRIGRLGAYQRLAHWLLETRDRLAMVGLATDEGFSLPITQELIADTLGLTSVHINRMMQLLRRDGLVVSNASVFTFPDRHRLESIVDYRTARVSASR